MMVAVTPLATIALTTLLVNYRHVFYAFTFPLHVVRNPVAKTYSVYALIDEAYAVTAAEPKGWTSWRLLTLQISFQTYWVGGGILGVLLAGVIPGKIEGLEFALRALFVTLALDACRTKEQVPSVLLASASFAVTFVVIPEQALFFGMIGFIVLLAVRYVFVARKGK